MSSATPVVIAVLVAELIPAAAFGFAAERMAGAIGRLPSVARIVFPVVLVLPYVVIATSQHIFRWDWFALYALLPVAMAWMLARAARADPGQRGDWRDAHYSAHPGIGRGLALVRCRLASGRARAGQPAPGGCGIVRIPWIRRLSGTGFDFHLRWSDWKSGLRELFFFAPLVIMGGLALGFLHPHTNVPAVGKVALTWAGVFVFVAVPEELFFRAWVQNLLERRVGRLAALVIASILFGLSHFNKRSAHFNWRYVLLATIAGIFYGRAWRENRRVPASSITHTFVDWLWSWWF